MKEKNITMEEVLKEIEKERKIEEDEKILVQVLINICKYYKINNSDKIVKYIENVIKV